MHIKQNDNVFVLARTTFGLTTNYKEKKYYKEEIFVLRGVTWNCQIGLKIVMSKS